MGNMMSYSKEFIVNVNPNFVFNAIIAEIDKR